MTCRQPARTEATPTLCRNLRVFAGSARDMWHSNGTPQKQSKTDSITRWVPSAATMARQIGFHLVPKLFSLRFHRNVTAVPFTPVSACDKRGGMRHAAGLDVQGGCHPR